MEIVSKGLLLLAAIIHLLPLLGLFGRKRLSVLYGLDIHDPNLLILLQHRAVLFGMVGTLLLLAVLSSHWLNLALFVGFVSALSFLLIALSIGGYNSALKRVLRADIVAILAMAGVLAIEGMKS